MRLTTSMAWLNLSFEPLGLVLQAGRARQRCESSTTAQPTQRCRCCRPLCTNLAVRPGLAFMQVHPPTWLLVGFLS